MANGDITKETEYDKIEVVQKWNIQVRQITRILEEQSDGTKKIISSTFNRRIILPFDSRVSNDGKNTWTHTATDISKEDAQVQAICNAAWTDDVKKEFKTFKEAQEVT